MKFAVLGSGSGGNAAVVDTAGGRLLVDAGLSAKQLVGRMGALGIAPESIDAILLTHEHGDHVRGLDVLLRKYPIPVFTTPRTREALLRHVRGEVKWRLFESGQDFALPFCQVRAFAIPHDAVDPVGFVIRTEEAAMGVLSDIGHVTAVVRENLRGLDGLFVEANYDDAMLEADLKRPWSTKQRISSRHGHLSNLQVAELLGAIAHQRLRRVMLGHLSQDCNCPLLARQFILDYLAAAGHPELEIFCATPDEPTAWMGLLPTAWIPLGGGALQGELF
jgi:phosphoribosyl 1,2-cyclic phosphodiesterase